ncbi:hypothetical protein EI94DRAFT_1216125 [Lactarius quietus]|nr:hypothetical protein EI94DRAFT_1216125 [Lactarius quietus]
MRMGERGGGERGEGEDTGNNFSIVLSPYNGRLHASIFTYPQIVLRPPPSLSVNLPLPSPPPSISSIPLTSTSISHRFPHFFQCTASQNLRADGMPRITANPVCLVELPDSDVRLSICPWMGFPCTASCPSCVHSFDVRRLPSEQRSPFSCFPLLPSKRHSLSIHLTGLQRLSTVRGHSSPTSLAYS